MCRKLIYLISCVLVLSISVPAKADLVITNGDFEAGAGAGDTENVSLWYDDVSTNFWESAWELDREGVTPNGSMVVVFCSWNTLEGDPLTGSYVYQSIGTSSGESSVTIGFDWGHPDDAAAGRLDGITIAAYASDGTTVPGDGVDINGAEGVTLLDSASYSHVVEGTDGEIFPVVVTLDLSGANAGDEIFLRFNNYMPEAGADPWPVLDNVQITSEPEPTAPFSLGAVGDISIGNGPRWGPDASSNGSGLEARDVPDRRHVFLISYDISGLKDRGPVSNVSLNNFSHDQHGEVNVYGVIEDLDLLDVESLTWNTAPGVQNDPAPELNSPVALDMNDLTDVLITFSGPGETGIRFSTDTSQALADFINSDTDGILTLLVAPSAENNQLIIRSREHEAGGTLLQGDAKPIANIVFVSFHGADDEPSQAAVDVGFTEASDKGYTDLLTANGYNVTRYITSGSPDADLLNAADLVVVSRAVASGGYSGDGATAWNSITTPMIVMQGWALRSSRMGYTTGTTMVDTAGDVALTVTDSAHPIFAGIDVVDGVMVNPFAMADIPVPTAGAEVSRGISINNDPIDDEGTILATVATADDPAVGGMVIGEWPAGATLEGSGGANVLAGPRLIFLTGSREPDGVTGGDAAGLYDLYPDGEQMLLNAVDYMVPAKPVDPGTDGLVAYYALDGDVLDASGNGLDGTIVGDPAFVEGVVGMALDLNGDDYVDCGNDPLIDTISEISVSAWLNIRSIPNAWTGAVVKGENAWRLSNVNEDPRFHFGITIWNAPDTASIDGTTAVGFDEWHNVTGTFDGANINVYLDGVLDGSIPTTEPIGISTTNMFIGENSESPGRAWDGLIDEVMIYNRALSEEELLFLASK